jgi:hypothetical protein
MQRLVLGVVLCAALGLPCHSADALSDPKAAVADHAGKRRVCHWVAANRTLRLLTDAPAPAIKKSTKMPETRLPVPKAAEPAQVVQRPNQRIALVVGIAY